MRIFRNIVLQQPFPQPPAITKSPAQRLRLQLRKQLRQSALPIHKNAAGFSRQRLPIPPFADHRLYLSKNLSLSCDTRIDSRKKIRQVMQLIHALAIPMQTIRGKNRKLRSQLPHTLAHHIHAQRPTLRNQHRNRPFDLPLHPTSRARRFRISSTSSFSAASRRFTNLRSSAAICRRQAALRASPATTCLRSFASLPRYTAADRAG